MSADEKTMWMTVEKRLRKVNVKNLGYAHPLCSGILDDSSEPFKDMLEELCNIFRLLSRKFIIPTDIKLKGIYLK